MAVDPHKIPAVFIRGGTSKGVFFKEQDLPRSREERDEIFLKVLGGPDPYQRQLNGMGGGLSSVSKVVIVDRSDRPDADIDYTFVQIVVDKPVADYGQTCGNLSASVGPFAVEEGIIEAADGETTIRVYNTNTAKIYHAHFQVRDGHAVEIGNYEMSGVGGSGAKIRLDYLDPGGAKSQAFLPSGHVSETIDVVGVGSVEVSLVDATNPVVFVAAEALNVTGHEFPEELESNKDLMQRLDVIRRQAGVRMGLGEKCENVPLSNPKVALVASSASYQTISGETISAYDFDIGIWG